MLPRKPGAREQSKDTSDEDEVEIDTERTVEDPIVAITAADGPTQSIDEMKAEEPNAPDDPPRRTWTPSTWRSKIV